MCTCVSSWCQIHCVLGHECEFKCTYVRAAGLPPMFMSRVTSVSLLCVPQTKSEAADELEKFRKTSEEKKSAGPPYSPCSPSLTCTSLPYLFSAPPPPPPPAPMIAPPPPPPHPVLPQGKPSTVAHPSSNTSMNPAMAREAMLEAIRSGSAAERLKKVRRQN